MKQARRMLSILLTLVMLLGTFSVVCSVAAAGTAKTYKVGDVIQFGNFPQTEVTDVTLRSKFFEIQKVWHSYNYYSGAGGTASWDDGKMAASDYMQYADFIYQPNSQSPKQAYRAVQFSAYRPYYSGGVANPTSNSGTGYAQNTVYYFKYEPLEWIVLDPGAKLLMSKKVLDAQAYQNYVNKNRSDTNDYAKSSLHDYLNNSFYNTAFSAAQKSAIQKTTYDCTPYALSGAKVTETVSANVTVLSYADCQKTAYGFKNTTNSDAARIAKEITDYAKIQGISITGGMADWWLRTADKSNAKQASFVGTTGALNHAATVNLNNKGVRPVITLTSLQANTDLNLATCAHRNTEEIPAVASTCSQPGKTNAIVCKDCGGVITPSKEVPALDHVDKTRLDGEKGSDGWCDVCGKELTIHLDNSGRLQLSGPFKNLIDMIRNLIFKLEDMLRFMKEKKPEETAVNANINPNPSTNTNTNTNTNTQQSNAGAANTENTQQAQDSFDSFVDTLSSLITMFKGISDQKSAEKEVERNNFFDRLTGGAGAETEN